MYVVEAETQLNSIYPTYCFAVIAKFVIEAFHGNISAYYSSYES